MKRIDLETTYKIAFDDERPTAFHKFDEKDRNAIEAAEDAQRPLLVRGEPGVGKSQLALAAAVATGRAFAQQVVNIRTEPQDLLWRDDPVARLADAQLIGALADAPEAARLGGHGTSEWFMIEDFVRCILEDTRPRLDVYDAMDYTLPGICAHLSAEQGSEIVTVPDLRR